MLIDARGNVCDRYGARNGGCRWASKRTSHPRYHLARGTMPGKFERFSGHAWKALALANQEANRLNVEHDEYICTEHILLGLVKEGLKVAKHAGKGPRESHCAPSGGTVKHALAVLILVGIA